MRRRTLFACAAAALLWQLPAGAATLDVTSGLSVPAGHAFALEAKVTGAEGNVSYSWKQLKGSVRVRLPGRGRAASMKLKTRWPGEYVFRCTVRLESGETLTADAHVLVTSPVTVPTAVISGELIRKVGAGSPVYISGEESRDPEDRALSYSWTQVSGPVARVREKSYSGPVLEFVPESPGRYVFALQVTAGRERSEPAVVIVEVPEREGGAADRAPVISVDYPEVASVGVKFVMDASATADPDGDDVRLSWLLVDAPEDVELSSDRQSVEFTPGQAGAYRFRLTARGGELTAVRDLAVRVAPGPATPAAPPAAAGISVEFRTEPLDEVLLDLSRRHGITIRIDPHWIDPARHGSMFIDLKLANVSEEILVTSLARILGARYHVEGRRAYWMERGYSFIGEAPREPISIPVSPAEADVVLSRLEETIKPAMLFGGGRLGKGTGDRSITGVLPAGAVRRLENVLRIASSPGTPPGHNALRPPVCEALGRPVLLKGDRVLLRDLIWDVAAQADMNICFRSSDLPDSGRRLVSIEEGPMTFSKALARLVEISGLASYRVDSPNTVWLYSLDPGPPGSNLWEASLEQGFDISRLVRRKGLTGSLVIHLVKNRVSPETWKDPATAIIYLPGPERLVAVNHPLVLGLVASFLEDLQNTGYRFDTEAH
ncbi:MAG: hypothetical protein JW909_14045 [Planctomycetes bacterium]|nr:hypothetical protein [Planctomycetota bacterium]